MELSPWFPPVLLIFSMKQMNLSWFHWCHGFTKCSFLVWSYCWWLRNPAAPKGWLKPYKQWEKPPLKCCRISQPSTFSPVGWESNSWARICWDMLGWSVTIGDSGIVFSPSIEWWLIQQGKLRAAADSKHVIENRLIRRRVGFLRPSHSQKQESG